jgi:hypothetical protein
MSGAAVTFSNIGYFHRDLIMVRSEAATGCVAGTVVSGYR